MIIKSPAQRSSGVGTKDRDKPHPTKTEYNRNFSMRLMLGIFCKAIRTKIRKAVQISWSVPSRRISIETLTLPNKTQPLIPKLSALRLASYMLKHAVNNYLQEEIIGKKTKVFKLLKRLSKTRRGQL